ncbi:MAG TPA: DUF3999 family protein [Bryobacteraceae bacterium]|jgi:hypothetical protein|nr:DUF3999 family protein [Bryobacteraceae bacterium]
MTRAPKFLLIFAVVASATTLDLSQWRYRKSIPLTPGTGLTVVDVDRDVYVGSATALADLLVIHDGKEVPFVIDTPVAEKPAAVPSEERLLDESVIPGLGLLFTIHLKRPVEHHAILLHTGEKNFRKRVRIETSQDGVEWALARSDGAIFNFSQDGREFSSMIVEYPVSTKPFVRVNIIGWMRTGDFGAAIVEHAESRQVAYEVFATLVPQVTEDAVTKSTVVTVDQGVSGLPVSRVLLQVLTLRFQRAAVIETSGDSKNWQYVGQQVIALARGPGFTEESLVLPVPGAQRFIRLRIYNRDDRPLQIGKLNLEGQVSEIKFLAPESGSYWLYYGNPAVIRPREYDLGAVIAHQTFREIKTPFNSPEVNPTYRPPASARKPWSEQHPAILYTVLGGAILALGIATLRFMSRLRTPA